MKVSEIIADFLHGKKIRHVFGMIGSANAHIFDSITAKGFTEIICVHHEQAACLAALAYYRICGRLSAAIVTNGPGSTNAITGVVSAWMDSIPCLIISGNDHSRFTIETSALRTWGTQGYDSISMVNKVTKYAQRVLDPNESLKCLEIAYYESLNERPGPCWIDFPMDIQAAQVTESNLLQFNLFNIKSSNPLPLTAEHPQVKQILNELKLAKRPVIWLGHGVRLAGATDLVETFTNTLRCPILTSWPGIDLIDSDHSLVFGRPGVYGQRAANLILQNCDFLLAIGIRLATSQVGYDLSELVREAKLALVDIDLAELTKYGKKVNISIHADAKKFMQAILDTFNTTPNKILSEKHCIWIQQCNFYKKKYPNLNDQYIDKEGYINSYRFIHKLSKFFKPDQIIVTDIGTAMLTTHQLLQIKKGQRLITSSGLAEMGYALPAAIGASFATKKGEVICIHCDGGMMLNLQELQTIVHHKLPIKIFIYNNDGYTMIKHTQKALFGRYSGTNKNSGVSCPDFSAVAKAFGIVSFKIKTWEDFESVIPKLQKLIEPVICEVFTHPEQLFFPKLSLTLQKDGSIISPPLEDLSPFLSREELRENMCIPMHPKSEALEV